MSTFTDAAKSMHISAEAGGLEGGIAKFEAELSASHLPTPTMQRSLGATASISTPTAP